MGNYQSSEGFTKTYTTKDAVILSGQSLSAAIDLEQLNIATIIFPASWTTADITFQTSADGVTYSDVINDSGVEVKRTPVTGKAMGVSIPELSGVRFLKVRSGTSASPVNQGADRTLTLILTTNAEGGGSSSGGGGASTIADGADVTEGAIADAVVAAGAAGTVSAKLRRLTTDLDAVKTALANVKPLVPTTYSMTVLNTTTNISANITQAGLTSELIVTAPSINGSGATYQIDILNANGKAIFSQSGYAESADSRILVNRNIITTDTIKITTSVTVGADKAFTVEVR